MFLRSRTATRMTGRLIFGRRRSYRTFLGSNFFRLFKFQLITAVFLNLDCDRPDFSLIHKLHSCQAGKQYFSNIQGLLILSVYSQKV